MNDLMLFSRLKDIGMPPDIAWSTTQQIRDKLHPVAAVAAAKILKAMGDKTKGLGAVSNAQGIQAGSAVAGAAAGAAYGSVVPGIGTAVGAVVGLVASMLIHTGQGPQRLAQAQAIDQALKTIPTDFVGRTIPWNGTATSPGLAQFLSALMTSSMWMSWDNSVVVHPGVNGNWVTTFIAAVKAVVNGIVGNAPGAPVTVTITLSPGGSAPPQPFTFINPGINAGPDAISANVIMGPTGLMYFIVKAQGETDTHASMNATSPAAQKVFALMVDHATADALPSSLSTTLANAPIVSVPPAVMAAAVPIATQIIASNQIPAITSSGTTLATVTTPTSVNTIYTDQYGNPITQAAYQQLQSTAALTASQNVTAGLMQNMLAAQGANFSSPAATQVLADVAANGVQYTPSGPSVLGALPSWAPWAAAAVVALLFLRRRGA